MLHLFRKYQKLIFFVVAGVTIASFLFYGTYETLFAPKAVRAEDPVVLRTPRRSVKKHYLDALCTLLKHESWMGPRYASEGNFLNEGIFTKYLLPSGLATELFADLQPKIVDDLQVRAAREQAYTAYMHPYVQTISLASVWSVFAPEALEALERLRTMEDKTDQVAFEARLRLLQAQMTCPPPLLTHILRYHQHQYTSMPKDPRLEQGDICVCGYKNLEDWLGETFLRTSAQTVLCCADLALELGYTVSAEEARADLMERAEKGWEFLHTHAPNVLQTPAHLIQLTANRWGMSEKEVVELWRDVLLFKKLFEAPKKEVATVVAQLQNHAHAGATVEVVQLPAELRFATVQDLARFEAYLAAACPPKEEPLALPTTFLPLDRVRQRAPELVYKRYQVERVEVGPKDLAAKVSLKELWEWMSDEAHRPQLAAECPELTQTTEPLWETIQGLAPKKRQRLERVATESLVAAHPQWVLELLQTKAPATQMLTLQSTLPVAGWALTDVAALEAVLEGQEAVEHYTQDGKTHYRIHVLQREPEAVFSFKEALAASALDPLVTRFDGKLLAEEAIEALKSRMPTLADAGATDAVWASVRCLALLEAPDSPDSLWSSLRSQKRVARNHPLFLTIEAVLEQPLDVLSTLQRSEQEGPYVYRVLDKTAATSLPEELVNKTPEEVTAEAMRAYFHTLYTQTLRAQIVHQ